MSDYEIASDLAQFIVDKFDSVAQLEALLLCRANSATKWTVEMVAKRLYISARQAEDVLKRLHVENLVGVDQSEPVRFCFCPGSPELNTLVDRLAEIYSKHLVPVTNLIHSKPKLRIQQFADAFRLRKDEQ